MRLLGWEPFRGPVVVYPGDTIVVQDKDGRTLAEETISTEKTIEFVGWQWAAMTEEELQHTPYDVGLGGFLVGNVKKQGMGLAES